MPVSQAKRRELAKEHLLYEVEQLHDLTGRLLEIWLHDAAHGGRDLDYLDMATRNAQVESFAINARALLDFLYADPRGDDASARHYVVGDWNAPEMTEHLKLVNRRVGKEIAHLTYHRTTLSHDARQWLYPAIWRDLAAVLRAFVSAASPDVLPEEVGRRIAELTVIETDFAASDAMTGTNLIDKPGRRLADGPGTATYVRAPVEDAGGTDTLP